MSIAYGINPKTKKKESYKFNDFDKALKYSENLKKKGYTKTGVESKTLLSSLWNL